MKILFFIFSMCALYGAPKAVVFDYGGVLTGESNTRPAVSFLCDSFGLNAEEYAAVNQQKKQAAASGKFDTEFWHEYAVNRGIALPLDWHERFVDSLRAAFPPNQEMMELVHALKKHMRVALFSNIDMRRAEFVRAWGHYDLFDPCILSYQIGVEKPHRRAYEILLNRLGLDGKDVLFIDDKLENVEGARAVGIDAIHFENAAQVKRELQKRGVKGTFQIMR